MSLPSSTDIARFVRHARWLRSQAILWRVLERPYRWSLRRRSARNGITRTIHGRRVRLRYPFGAIASSDYEHAGFETLDSLLQPGMTFFDVGASFGLYSLAAAFRVGPSGRVYAFEPTRSAAAALRDHLELNGFADRAYAIEAAVDEHSGSVVLHEPKADWLRGTNMMASFSDTWVAARRSFAETMIETTECAAVSLDDFCAEHGVRPDVLKIDVEGAEGRVLRGARGFLAGQSGRILLEIHPYALRSLGDSEAGVLAVLEEAGWAHEEVETKSELEILETRQYICKPGGASRA